MLVPSLRWALPGIVGIAGIVACSSLPLNELGTDVGTAVDGGPVSPDVPLGIVDNGNPGVDGSAGMDLGNPGTDTGTSGTDLGTVGTDLGNPGTDTGNPGTDTGGMTTDVPGSCGS